MNANKMNLLLLPGLLNDERLWRHQMESLDKAAACTVADLTGHHTIAALANAALAQMPPGPFAMAGLSMGGYVALEIMRHAPERVVALALLDTSARPDSPESRENRLKLMALADQDFPEVVNTLIPKLLHPLHQKDAAITTLIRGMAERVGKDAFMRQQRAIMSRVDSRQFLHQISCPTLVLCGREDGITPVEMHEEMVVAIRGAQVEIIDGCGHLSAIERPVEVSRALEKWLVDANLRLVV